LNLGSITVQTSTLTTCYKGGPTTVVAKALLKLHANSDKSL